MTHHDETKTSGHDGGGHGVTPQDLTSMIRGVDFGALLRASIPFFIGLVGMAIIGWLIWSPLIYAKKYQPVDFNHQVHMEAAGMTCEDCHYYEDDGRFSGIPAAESCLDCHNWSSPQNEENEKEKAFLEEFVNEDDEYKKPLVWYVYSKQPDCVYFSHIAHTQNAGFECKECHKNYGGESSGTKPYYENRITGYSKFVFQNMKMDDCAACHKKNGQPQNNACFVCHK